MTWKHAVVAGIALGTLASAGVIATAAGKAPVRPPDDRAFEPALPADTGAGELLIAVVGGVFPSRQEAESANEALAFGDLQGYYVVPVAQFQGFRQEMGEPGEFALVSAFRTEEGAREFAELAATLGIPATILPERVRSLGGLYAGLGQEASPDGTGPLLGPVAESLP
ncbi:MAG TPA: hypothetical protein VFM40_07575 [Actinomycetota bacterium]|nr:hypothetical protein [Actinomycetota bacterium]